MKKLLLSSIFAGASLAAMAIPARPGEQVVVQSDGTEITVRLIGDEHFHTYLTSDGLTIGRGADGDFYYMSANGLTEVKAHNPAQRKNEEKSFLQKNGSDLSVVNLWNMRSEVVEQRRAPQPITRTAITQVPNNGSPRVPILLVEYFDKRFKDEDPKATFEGFFNKDEQSAFKYFSDQSNGKFTPQFDVYGPITLPNDRKYYGQNDMWGNDKRVGEMVAEGAKGLDSEIDFSLYDNDGDGECDVLIVLYAGDGEASSTDRDAENAVWPLQWNLQGSDYGKVLTLDKTRINKFAVFNELNGTNRKMIDGIGTFCHEFSHCLGLPDFYDTKYSGFFGMGPWSLMDSGSYNNNAYTPCGYSAYEKEFMGWIDIEEGVPGTFYTLPVFNSKDASKDKAVRLTNIDDKDEYYILENRRKQGWDTYMASEGLFIYHVTYNERVWDENKVNDYPMQRMTPVPADNDLKMNRFSSYGQVYYDVDKQSLKGDLWPYQGNDAFTDTSVPASLFNSQSYLGKPVTEIALNEDGTASFWLVKEASGIEDISIDNNEVEYCTLQGIKVASPIEKGIYIKKQNGKTTKVII